MGQFCSQVRKSKAAVCRGKPGGTKPEPAWLISLRYHEKNTIRRQAICFLLLILHGRTPHQNFIRSFARWRETFSLTRFFFRRSENFQKISAVLIEYVTFLFGQWSWNDLRECQKLWEKLWGACPPQSFSQSFWHSLKSFQLHWPNKKVRYSIRTAPELQR